MLPLTQLTGTAIVTEALENLQAMAAGDPLNATDGAKGLAVLNRLIDSSTIAKGNVFTERIDTWTTVIGQQTYTIGVDPAGIQTATLTPADRPVRVTRANLLLFSGGPGSTIVRRKITLLDKEQWSRKAVQQVSGMPVEMYNDGAYPLSTYWLYMIPDQAYEFETYSWQEPGTLSTLATVFSFPPGYYEYYLAGLEIRLAAPFGREPSAATLALYQQTRADIMTQNAVSPRIKSDGDFADGGGGLGSYNWISGLDNED